MLFQLKFVQILEGKFPPPSLSQVHGLQGRLEASERSCEFSVCFPSKVRPRSASGEVPVIGTRPPRRRGKWQVGGQSPHLPHRQRDLSEHLLRSDSAPSLQRATELV